jgi:hypothetical protein
MIKKIDLLLSLLILSLSVFAQTEPKWVEIGEGTYKAGFIYPYKVQLSVPYGVRNIAELKQKLLPMRFELIWLPNTTSKKEIKKLFSNQLEEKFDSVESFKLSKNLIYLFLRKLPATTRHEHWVFEYYPDLGTKLFIKDKKVYHLVGAELNRALIDSWINKSPVLTANLFNRLLKLQ